MSWDTWAAGEARAIRASDRWRAPRDLDGRGPATTIAADGRAVVSFASNDYLGLTAHPAVITAAHEALDRWGTGSGSARLIVGSRPVHSALERELAAWKSSDRAALFPTGFAANLGVLTTFGGPGVLICSDELNHASIIDGCRLAAADVSVYGHRDLEHLRALLHDRGARRALVVSDTVFSMDGDVVDVAALGELCAQEHALLVFDEAHAVLGHRVETDPDADVLRVGTCSKTLGALGGFVAGPSRYVELIENSSRPYIFTTAPTPADAAAALAALRIVRSPEGDALVARLRANVNRLRPGHPSPILPFVCGTETRAVDAAALLLARGIVVPAIRPPTVAPGTSRFRVALSAAHTDDQIDRLVAALEVVFPEAAVSTMPEMPAPRDSDTRIVIVAIAGTGTEIGKTWVTAAVASALRERGIAVTARKPVQSFAPDATGPTDADVLAAATGESPHDVCPHDRWLPSAMAPPMAAEQLGLAPFTIADLVSELGTTTAEGTTLVETAGGVRSPLADDGDSADFARALRPALIVLVADAGLGTINLVRLSTAALAPHRPLVYLNRFDREDDLHARNREWLETRVGLDIVTDIEALANRIAELQPLG